MNPNNPSFTYAIIGLGNPGKNYRDNRHNIGIIFVDWLHQKLTGNSWQKKATIPALISTTNNKLLLAKTLTFMNESGRAVKNIMRYYKIPSSKIIIVQDDTDILWGKYKFSFNKGSAGHKGIESIFQYLKTKKFYRLRIGVRPEKTQGIKAKHLVLQNLSSKEKKELPKIFTKIFFDLQDIICPQHLEYSEDKR